MNLSVSHSDSAAKKIFPARAHFPAIARICARDEGRPGFVPGDLVTGETAAGRSPRSGAHGAALRLFGKTAMMNRPFERYQQVVSSSI